MKHNPCRIIGVLDNGIEGMTPSALAYIKTADLIIGVPRTLKMFDEYFKTDAEQRDMTGKFIALPDWIRQAQTDNKRVMVLATGDPLCHGIAAFLQARLCIEAIEVSPNLSMVQLACARLGMPWQDLKICSVHGRDVGEWQGNEGFEHGLYPLLQAALKHDRLAIFTSPQNTPDRIARLLVDEGLADDFNMAVAEHLMLEDEKIVTKYSVRQVADLTFAHPNMVVLWRTNTAAKKVLFGLNDEHYKQRKPDKGLITKREIRAVSLARMQLRHDSIVWDIGAASGSVGLEAARLAADGFVYAIEKNQADMEIALHNKQQLGIHNYKLVHARAPQELDNWQDPDAVFIGGSGGNLADLIRLVVSRLKPHGTLVMNFITIENLAMATDTLKELDLSWDVTQLQISRSRPILHMHRFKAENPVWIVSAQQTKEKTNCHPREGGDP